MLVRLQPPRAAAGRARGRRPRIHTNLFLTYSSHRAFTAASLTFSVSSSSSFATAGGGFGARERGAARLRSRRASRHAGAARPFAASHAATRRHHGRSRTDVEDDATQTNDRVRGPRVGQLKRGVERVLLGLCRRRRHCVAFTWQCQSAGRSLISRADIVNSASSCGSAPPSLRREESAGSHCGPCSWAVLTSLYPRTFVAALTPSSGPAPRPRPSCARPRRLRTLASASPLLLIKQLARGDNS